MLIAKTFDFDAAHFLPNVPDGHKCKRLHGHTYRVTLEVASNHPLDAVTGWIIDYAGIAKAWDEVNAILDHRLLNEIDGLANPTTELLALWLLLKLGAELPDLAAIVVHESSTTWCRVERRDLQHNMHRFVVMPGLVAPAAKARP
jgi:6-pyruvoyltetrahydropterin/6-carboxytetrahydropterin synthase